MSFAARTVDWDPPHLYATPLAAHRHQGLSFVQIIQRCPQYKLGVHDPLQSDPSLLLLMTHENGIQLDDDIALFRQKLRLLRAQWEAAAFFMRS